MARMVVIYRTPKNVEAFDRHYFDVHIPLAKKLPGLRKYEVSHGPVAVLAGSSDVHLIDFDAIRAVLADDVKLDLVSRLKLEGRDRIGLWRSNRIIAIRDFLFAAYALEAVDWVRLG